MGICYGAQLAAHALGGVVTKGGAHEIGWYYVDSHDPALCPPGPWLQYHYDSFTVPRRRPLAGRVRRRGTGFRGRVRPGAAPAGGLAVPSRGVPDDPGRWVADDAEALPRNGVDGAAFVAEAQQRALVARAAAHALVDVTLDAMGLVRATA